MFLRIITLNGTADHLLKFHSNVNYLRISLDAIHQRQRLLSINRNVDTWVQLDSLVTLVAK